ncbi:hypothetical protein PHSY_004596 [Pseudozyma hubeiensis SY62]|uniref:Uncharacterized protein n=1 Tax=Pseudozyma hubeiensis (strain SY62) TaxID=1305764 RepID=R9P6Y5_PSEHS|nr:hypothetical protein PHSY_004596 [Pseudozyma hubeiensis SY62]GAC97012.1 hypothetical protein PHSY_004596 [Pseudozyma hubeiensis SY62]
MWSNFFGTVSFEQVMHEVADAPRQLEVANLLEHSNMHQLTESHSMQLRGHNSFIYEGYPVRDHVVRHDPSSMLRQGSTVGMVDLDYLLQPSGLKLKLDTSSIESLLSKSSTSSSTPHGKEVSLSEEASRYHSATSSMAAPPVAQFEIQVPHIHDAPGHSRGTDEMAHTTNAIAKVHDLPSPFPLMFDLPSRYVWAPSTQLKTQLLSQFESRYLLSPDQFTDLSYSRLAGESLPRLMKQALNYFRPRSYVFAYKLSGHGVLVKFHHVGSIKEGRRDQAALSLWTIEPGVAGSSVLSGRGVLGVDASVIATLRHSFGIGTYVVSNVSPEREGKRLILKDYD